MGCGARAPQVTLDWVPCSGVWEHREACPVPDTEQQVQLKGALAGIQVPTCLGFDASGGTYPHLCALVG